MDYTIVNLQDWTSGGLNTLDLGKSGNQYRVTLRSKEGTGAFRSKRFDTIDEAEAVFQRLAACFIRGEYDFEGRTKILMESHFCKYCGQLAKGTDSDLLCDDCRELFGHTFFSEL